MATLRTRELTKSFSGRTVVRGVSLEIASGEVVGLLGPNGAGKTTTFSMVVGLTAPDSGRVLLDGTDVTDDPMYVRARKGIGYLPQEASIFRGLTVEQNILAILETVGGNGTDRRTRLRELLGELGLTPLAKSPAYTLSGGERRRVEITRALVISPQFMLLDEPFAGIDPIAVTDIQQIIFHLKSRGIGVLITDHNVRETLKITDRAYIVHDGMIFRSGTPDSLAADEDVKGFTSAPTSDWTKIEGRLPLASMAIQQRLHTKLVQKLILTPSLQQAIKLLPMSTLELSDLLNQEMVENPLLEEVPTEELQPAEQQQAEKPEPEKPVAEKADNWDDAGQIGRPAASSCSRTRHPRFRCSGQAPGPMRLARTLGVTRSRRAKSRSRAVSSVLSSRSFQFVSRPLCTSRPTQAFG